MTSASVLKKRIQELHALGKSERTHTNVQKLSGLVTILSGTGIAFSVGVGFGIIPISVGAIAYLTRLPTRASRP